MNPIAMVAAGVIATAGWWITRRKAEYGLAILVALLPLERLGAFALQTNGATLVRPAQLFGLGLTLAVFMQLPSWRRLPSYVVPLGILGTVVAAAALAGQHPQLWYNAGLFGLAAALAVAVSLSVNRAALDLMSRAVFWSAGVVCLFGVYQYLGDILGLPGSLTGLLPGYSRAVLGYTRLQSTALEPLYFAYYLLVPLLIGGALAMADLLSRWQRWVLALAGLCFLLTFSRGALLAIVPGALLLVLYRQRLGSRVNWRSLLLIAAAAIILTGALMSLASVRSRGSWLAGPSQFGRLLTTQLTTAASFQERATGQAGAIWVFTQRPLLGVGMGRFRHQPPPPERLGYDTYSVNNLSAELLAETGVLGFGAFLATVVWMVRQAAIGMRRHTDKLLRAWQLGTLAAFLAMLLQLQTFSGFFMAQLWAVLGLLGGLARLPARYNK